MKWSSVSCCFVKLCDNFLCCPRCESLDEMESQNHSGGFHVFMVEVSLFLAGPASSQRVSAHRCGVGKNRDIGMDEGLQKKQAWHAYLPCDLKFCSYCFNDDLESSGGAFFVPMLPYDGPVSRVTSSQLPNSTPLPWGILPAFHRAP